MEKLNHLFPSCQVSILGDPPKDVNLPQGAFLNVNSVFPSGEILFFGYSVDFYFSVLLPHVTAHKVLSALYHSGGSCRPHPYRRRPTLSNVSNQHMHQSVQPNYSLRYQDSYSPDFPPLHQVTSRFPLCRPQIHFV